MVARGGLARSVSGMSAVSVASTLSNGIVVVWPFAVIMTAVCGVAYSQVVWFMVDQVTASPTESAAAALFAVIVAFSSSGFNAKLGGPTLDNNKRNGKGVGQGSETEATQAVNANPHLLLPSSLDNLRTHAEYVMDQWRYTNHYLNQQYACSLQYLQQQYFDQQAVMEKLNALSQFYCSEHQGHPAQIAGQKEECLSLEEEREASGPLAENSAALVRRHASIHDLFSGCAEAGRLPAFGEVADLFGCGNAGREAEEERGWKRFLTKSTETVEYSAWSMPLRRGFKVYRTETVFRDATSSEFIRFMTDDAFRREWDDTSGAWDVEPAAPGARRTESNGRDRVRISEIYCKVRIPPPFRSRQYFLQRSVWTRDGDGDGEILCSSRLPLEISAEDEAKGQGSVTVTDYLSLCSARNLPGREGEPPSVAVTLLYFEDTRLPSQLVNQIVACRMENTLVKTEKAMREHIRRARGRGAEGADKAEEADGVDGVDGAEGDEGKKKSGVKRIGSAVAVACLMPHVGARWVLPVILSEITKIKQSRV